LPLFWVSFSALRWEKKQRSRAVPAQVFITPDGCFLTNYHVIEGSNKIQVQVGDKLYNAKIIKTDPANDIAILKTEGQFVPLSIGAANQSHIGDDVFTIGFPAPLIQGFAPKLTKGSINAASGLQDSFK
jgi:S1-C subfamily serine protease